MSNLIIFLIFTQTLGAFVGAFSAVWSELAYLRAMRDGTLDDAERAHILVIARGLRFGMMLLLLSSFGLVVTAYLDNHMLQPALTPSYWILIALALLIITAVWALVRKHVSFHLGSAAIFAAWWFLLFLSIGWLPLTFGAAIASLAVATTIFYGVLYYVRLFATPVPPPQAQQ